MQGFLAQKYNVKHCFPPSGACQLWREGTRRGFLWGAECVMPVRGSPERLSGFCLGIEALAQAIRFWKRWGKGACREETLGDLRPGLATEPGTLGKTVAVKPGRGCPWGSPRQLCWQEEPWTEDGYLGTGVYNTGGRMVLTGDCEGSTPSLSTSLATGPHVRSLHKLEVWSKDSKAKNTNVEDGWASTIKRQPLRYWPCPCPDRPASCPLQAALDPQPRCPSWVRPLCLADCRGPSGRSCTSARSYLTSRLI